MISIGKLRRIGVHVNDMDFECGINHITLFVGANGTGKSLTMKLQWMLGIGMMMYSTTRKKGEGEAFMQFVFDNTLRDNDLTGYVNLEWDNGRATVELHDGQVIKADFLLPEDVEMKSMPIYMSADVRTFNQIDMYLSLRKALGVPDELDMTNADEMQKLTGAFRLYDILYVEALRRRLSIMEYKVDETLREQLKTFEVKSDVVSFGFDKKRREFYLKTSQGEQVALTKFSAGYQSIFNILLAQSLF